MKQNELRPPVRNNRPRKRVGRGEGSGTGKTAGRGQKGQKSRTGGAIRVGFEGGQTPLIQRMPYKRGFTNPFKVQYEIINLSDLEKLDTSAELTPESMLAMGLISHAKSSVTPLRVKLLGDGEIARPVNIRVHKVSAGARAKIEAAGGVVAVLDDAPETGDSPAAAGEE